jgi:peptide subunit release factor 1 (eRF1)
MPSQPTAKDILDRVLPVLERAERRGELELLDRIAPRHSVWGLDPVLDALQLGRVEVLVLPWTLEARIRRCENNGAVAGSLEMAQRCTGRTLER